MPRSSRKKNRKQAADTASLSLNSSSKMFCKNENSLIFTDSQLELLITSVVDGSLKTCETASTVAKWRTGLSVSGAVFTFCVAPLLTTERGDFKKVFGLSPEGVFYTLSVFSGISLVVAGICLFLYILGTHKHAQSKDRNTLISESIKKAHEQYSDRPAFKSDD